MKNTVVDFVKNHLVNIAAEHLSEEPSNLVVMEVNTGYIPKGKTTHIVPIDLSENTVPILWSSCSDFGKTNKWCLSLIELNDYSYVLLQDQYVDDYNFVVLSKKHYKSFRKAQRKLYNLLNPKQIEYDIVIEDSLKSVLLKHTVEFYTKVLPQFEKFNLSKNKGIILYGEPGNGKTSLVKWISDRMKEVGATVKSVNNIKELLELKDFKGTIVYDDIDINMLNRSRGGDVATELLKYLDGFDRKKSQIRLFTTNEDLSDTEEAFLRPGRIDIAIEIPNPGIESRTDYFHGMTERVKDHIKLDDFIEITEGYSFAKLASLYSAALSSILIEEKNPDIHEIVQEISNNNIKSAKKKKIGLV